MRKRLPLGIQTFAKIRDKESDFAYIDKTGIAHRLIENGQYYFISRPRRFGKSLFLDTLSELFKGSKDLFEGLYIYDRWNWEKRYPVIRIDFSIGDFAGEKGIRTRILDILEHNRKEAGVACDFSEDIPSSFNALICAIYEAYRREVVILADEYDKPILDNLSNTRVAAEAREILRRFYGTIKGADRYLKFVLLTGVSKFSRMNLFSGLNNLQDITLSKDYATITGFTQYDLESVFAEHLKDVDMRKVKTWYNGYNYFEEPLYNPYDILLFLSNRCEFKNYWWGTGNPAFLVEKLREQDYFLPELENVVVGEETLDSFDVEHVDLVALLWQTGYLTFDEKLETTARVLYRMRVPNLEIQNSLNELFFAFLTGVRERSGRREMAVAESIRAPDFESLRKHLTSVFASIPHSDYVKNTIAHYEGYYASVLYTYLAALGFEVIAEDTTNRGRVDLSLRSGTNIMIFEFKVDSAEDPLAQIKTKRYCEKYLSEGKDIYLVGMKFDKQEGNISGFAWEKVEPNASG